MQLIPQKKKMSQSITPVMRKQTKLVTSRSFQFYTYFAWKRSIRINLFLNNKTVPTEDYKNGHGSSTGEVPGDHPVYKKQKG